MIILSATVAPTWQSMHLTFLLPSRLCAAARVTCLPSTGWNSVNFFSCRWQDVQNVLSSSKWSVTTIPPPNAATPSRGTPTRRRGSQRRILRIPCLQVLPSDYCTRTLSVFENWMRPDGAAPPPGGASYLPLFISLASPVPYKNAAVTGYSPGVDGAFSI